MAEIVRDRAQSPLANFVTVTTTPYTIHYTVRFCHFLTRSIRIFEAVGQGPGLGVIALKIKYS